MGNGAEENVRKLSEQEAAYVARGVNRVTTALTDTINSDSLKDVPPGHKMFGSATALAAMIRSYVPEDEWATAIDAFANLMRTVLSSQFEQTADGSASIIKPRSVQ